MPRARSAMQEKIFPTSSMHANTIGAPPTTTGCFLEHFNFRSLSLEQKDLPISFRPATVTQKVLHSVLFHSLHQSLSSKIAFPPADLTAPFSINYAVAAASMATSATDGREQSKLPCFTQTRHYTPLSDDSY